MLYTKSSSTLKTFIALLFVMSGMTGLIYQVVWFKYLAIFLGSTTYAQMIVLSAFMGGLAIGNHFAGRIADRLKNPLLVYSILEFLIGLYCFAYPQLSKIFGDIFIELARAGNISETGGVLFTAVRIILSVLLLILPTIAMGATLPVLSKSFISDIVNARKDMAILYALNSLGAVMGVVFAGFYLINFFGLQASLYAGAAVNLFIGAAGAALSFLFRGDSLPADIPAEINDNAAEQKLPESGKLIFAIVAVAGISGFAAFVYEMVWVRLLIHIFGSSTYAFSIMLMAFISGITLGSIIASSAFLQKYDKVKVAAFSQAAIGLSTLPILLIYERLMYYFWVLASLLVKNDTTFSIYLFLQFAICFFTIIIPTVFMGISLPVIVSIVADNKKIIGASVGRVFSVNTVGTVLGSILAGLLFIPWLGMRGTFVLGIFFNLASALVIYLLIPSSSARGKYTLAGSFSAVVLIVLFIFPDWDVKLATSSVFRRLNTEPMKSFSDFKKSVENRDVIFYKEGTNANVCVVQYKDSTAQRVLVINGKADASSKGDMPTQVMLGQIPMLLHNNAKDVFIVGLGSGVTAGSVLTHPVNSVTCAELSEEVVEAARFFAPENNNCLKDPKLKILIEDAHTALKLSPKQYDVIISEPSNPWIAGIGNLFSVEYFELCKSKLRQGGVMVQWFHIYEMDDDALNLVLNTFSTVFPDAQLWASKPSDIILVGAKDKIDLNMDALNLKFEIPAVKKNLERIRINSPFTFLTSQLLSSDGFYAISYSPEINSELHPLLEFRAPRSLFKGKGSVKIFMEDERYSPSVSDLYVEKYSAAFPPDSTALMDAARFHAANTLVQRIIYALTKNVLDKHPAHAEAFALNVAALDALNLHRARTPLLGAFSSRAASPSEWKEKYYTDKIREEILSTSFLGRGNLDVYADSLIYFSGTDSTALIKTYAALARDYYLNDEPAKSFIYCEKVRELAVKSPWLANKIDTEKFIQTATLTAVFTGNFRHYLSYLVTLISSKDLEKKKYTIRLAERIFKRTI